MNPTAAPVLLQPLTLRGVTLRNRIMISPMCQYSAPSGHAGDWHLVHLGQYALGGAGLIVVEATAVEPRGRISALDLGLWQDSQIEPLARIARFLSDHGAVPGIQLGHAGYKASSAPVWEGAGPLSAGEGWETVAPSGGAPADDWPEARALDVAEIDALVDAWEAAARRAVTAGFRVVEIHGAHGYLLHQFLSPVTNRRNDAYGGTLEGRMRLFLRVAERVRAALPEDVPLFVRISSMDGSGEHWTMADSITLARALKARGVDVIDCSSGGIDGPTPTRIARGYGFQVSYAEQIREGAGMPTVAVGLIVDPRQAEEIVAGGHADIVAIAREALADPYWANRAYAELTGGVEAAPLPYRFWLERRLALRAELGPISTSGAA